METYGGPLQSAIEAFQDARIDQTSTGAQITATAANGHSVTFAAPSDGFSQEDLVDVSERLLTLLEQVAATESLDADDEANNDDLLDAMLLRLKPVKSASLRLAGSYFP